ncbi:phytoene desaturase family protein [Desulfobacter sp.]|uniref:phytoene desaturase family protein n=1 Tax=Desulfobacter sp. TaxID=2294 RepID=UPI003D0AA1A0
MINKPEVIIAGAGLNGLTVAGYLAKAGVDVLVLESKEFYGGGVVTREVAAPGFKADIGSTCHVFIQPNPLIQNDELQLISKYGLEYIHPDNILSVVFPDDRFFTFYKDLDKTCDSIAQFSQKDAATYRRFYEWGAQQFDMLISGMYAPAPPFGTLISLLSSSPEGREMARTMYVSAHDLAMEWFEDPHVLNSLDRWASENMMDPRVDGSGINLLLMIPMLHKYGVSIPKGGSGVLSDSIVRSIEARGGEVRVNSKIRQFKISGGKCMGVILENGEEILASKGVVSSFNIRQLTPEVIGTTMPEEYSHNLHVIRKQQFMSFNQNYALDEPPQYNAGSIVDKSLMVEFCSDTLQGMQQLWDTFAYGDLNYETPICFSYTQYDTTRAPAGKSTLYLYQYAPYYIKGGPKRWDEIKEEIADKIFENYCKRTKNITPGKVIGRWAHSPLDYERNFPSFMEGQINHMGSQISQNFGNRPFPLVSGYRLPGIDNLYLCGCSLPPGPGVFGGGRAAVQPVFEDLGIDFEDVLNK